MIHTHTNYDAIIIGGGHNGLVAACYLAKAGKTVLLLEAHDELGGATTSVKPFPEYDSRLSRYSYLVSLLPDQIVSQANAASASKKSDWIIPMAIKVIRDSSRRVARAGGQVYVCEFEGFEAGKFIGREDLKIVSDCLYEFQPPIPGV